MVNIQRKTTMIDNYRKKFYYKKELSLQKNRRQILSFISIGNLFPIK